MKEGTTRRSKPKRRADNNKRGFGRTARSRIVPLSRLSERSQSARDRALHVLSAMRRDPKLSLSRAAKLEAVKPATVWKYFPRDLKKSNGKFRVTKRDRHAVTLYLPDSRGEIVPRETRSSAERTEASNFLRDLGRYARGARNNLSSWQGKTIGGVDLLTDPETIRAVEPALSDFSLYRTFSGGAG